MDILYYGYSKIYSSSDPVITASDGDREIYKFLYDQLLREINLVIECQKDDSQEILEVLVSVKYHRENITDCQESDYRIARDSYNSLYVKFIDLVMDK